VTNWLRTLKAGWLRGAKRCAGLFAVRVGLAMNWMAKSSPISAAVAETTIRAIANVQQLRMRKTATAHRVVLECRKWLANRWDERWQTECSRHRQHRAWCPQPDHVGHVRHRLKRRRRKSMPPPGIGGWSRDFLAIRIEPGKPASYNGRHAQSWNTGGKGSIGLQLQIYGLPPEASLHWRPVLLGAAKCALALGETWSFRHSPVGRFSRL
jgi:hypothetical protein